jgi:glycosyltransferase involved in cell wall biosynthesis
LDAAQRLRSVPDLTFLFIGDGHRVGWLKDRVEQMGLGGMFQFRPYQPREDLAHSLSVADVHWLSLRPELEGLIVPSKFYGIAAAGRATIAVTAPDGEIGQLVLRHNCGVQVNPGDGETLADWILRLRQDNEFRETLGSNAKRLSELRFSRTRSLELWSELLDELRDPAPH